MYTEKSVRNSQKIGQITLAACFVVITFCFLVQKNWAFSEKFLSTAVFLVFYFFAIVFLKLYADHEIKTLKQISNNQKNQGVK
jgi:hypothetical protein